MVTKQDCLTGRYFRYLQGTYSRSKELKQVRASGKCQTWKTRPDDFKLPVKYGMYESLYITPANAALFITEQEYQDRKGQVLKNPRSGNPAVKTHKGIYYFPTYSAAKIHAEMYGYPTNRIIRYERGWAIQLKVSGPYVGPMLKNPAAFTMGIQDTEIHTWFERDRAHVELRNKRTQQTIVEWWDEDVQQAVEDGFLNARDWHSSAYQYAEEMGMLGPKRTKARKNPAGRKLIPTRIGLANDPVSATIKKNAVGEYVVRLWEHGEHIKAADYFATDSDDAVATARDMVQRASEKWGRMRHAENPSQAEMLARVNPTKLRPLGANQTELETDSGITVFFSYQTPVAAHIPGMGYYITEKKWSETTTKHNHKWLRMHGSHQWGTFPQEEFDKYLSSGQVPTAFTRSFNKNPGTLRASKKYAPRRRAYFDTKEKGLRTFDVANTPQKIRNDIYVQQQRGAMWFTLAVTKNTDKGRKIAHLWAQRYHRKHPNTTLRLFV